MSNDKEQRVARSVRLTSNINDRLIALCDHLGATPNSYLVGVIGKAIATDELAFLSKQNTQDMLNLVKQFAEDAEQVVESGKQLEIKDLDS